MSLITFIPLVFLLVPVLSLTTGKFTPRLAVFLFAVSFVLSVICWLQPDVYATTASYTWFKTSDTEFKISFLADGSTLMTMSFVTLIGFLVASYGLSYFKNSERRIALFTILSLFMSSMTGLILSGNLLFSFVCWELVGFCSYLLIGFYQEQEKAGKAATKALLINKIGDIGFLISLMGIWAAYGSFDLMTFSQTSAPMVGSYQYLIGLGLLTAIFAKSAQFPFHTWLPDAMAGPTPVSALIHSATMVAAGVWLLSRVHFLLPDEILWIAGLSGMVTALLGAWNAFFQIKIKYLLAWSTVSQLGLMMMAAGWGTTDSAVMHLITHGFFKAGLFLTAGYLLLQLTGNPEDELSAIASLRHGDRLAAYLLIIFTFSLAGLPLSASFLSKEAIADNLSLVERSVFFVISGFTILYASRLIWLLKPFLIASEKKSVNGFTWPMIPLALASVWWIWSIDPIGLNSYSTTGNSSAHLSLTILAGVFTVGVAYFTFLGFQENKILFYRKKEWVVNIDSLLHGIFIVPIHKTSSLTAKVDRLVIDRLLHGLTFGKVAIAHLTAAFDRFVIDGLVELIAMFLCLLGQLIRKATNGTIQSYLWWSLIALLILVIWQQ